MKHLLDRALPDIQFVEQIEVDVGQSETKLYINYDPNAHQYDGIMALMILHNYYI